jgi:hypothetical protein
MPKRNQLKTFEEQIESVFEEKPENACDVCSQITIAFQQEAKDTIKKKIGQKPLNKDHQGTYRQKYEFIVKDNVWNATMRKDNKYICLECWERDFLTPLLKRKTTDRKPNEFGFFHISPKDIQFGNPVNNNFEDFYNAVQEDEQEKEQQAQNQKDVQMIGKHDMEHGFDD